MSNHPAATSVLIVTATAMRRGAEIEACEVAAGLRDRGLEVSVVALEAGSGAGAGLGLQVLGGKPFSFSTLSALRSRSREHDVVIAWGSTALPACAVALPGGKPWIYRSIGQPSTWVRGALHRAVTGMQFRRASWVVALWAGAADEIEMLYGVRREKLEVIPNVRPLDKFRPVTPSERKLARSRFSLPSDSVVAICLGALSEEKCVALAIDAVASVPDVHLLVVGDGPLLEQLKRASAERGSVGERVHFLGAMSDPREALAAADVLVVSSRTEGMPGSIIEALLMGVAVAAVPVGAIPEMLNGIDSCRVVSTRAPTELAAAISSAAASSKTSREAAAELAATEYGLTENAAKWATAIARLAESHRRNEPSRRRWHHV